MIVEPPPSFLASIINERVIVTALGILTVVH
jgi:hypothetical protein